MSVTYTATLSVREETVLYLASLLHAERLRRGTRKNRRALGCFKQAVLVIRWFLDGTRVKHYQVGTDIPLANNVQADKNEIRVPVKAGFHAIGITFIANTYIPQVFLNHSYKRSILDDRFGER